MQPGVRVLPFFDFDDIWTERPPCTLLRVAFPYLPEFLIIKSPPKHPHPILPLHCKVGHFQGPGQLPIIRQDEQAFGEVVEAADGDDVGGGEAAVADALEDGGAVLGVAVRGDQVLGFVEEPDAGVVFHGGVGAGFGDYLDVVGGRDGAVSRHQLSIYLDHSRRHQLLSLPP